MKWESLIYLGLSKWHIFQQPKQLDKKQLPAFRSFMTLLNCCGYKYLSFTNQQRNSNRPGFLKYTSSLAIFLAESYAVVELTSLYILSKVPRDSMSAFISAWQVRMKSFQYNICFLLSELQWILGLNNAMTVRPQLILPLCLVGSHHKLL